MNTLQGAFRRVKEAIFKGFHSFSPQTHTDDVGSSLHDIHFGHGTPKCRGAGVPKI